MAGVGAGLSSMKCGRLHSLERNFEGDAEVFWTILHKTIVLCKIASFPTIASLDKASLLVKKSGLTTSFEFPPPYARILSWDFAGLVGSQAAKRLMQCCQTGIFDHSRPEAGA